MAIPPSNKTVNTIPVLATQQDVKQSSLSGHCWGRRLSRIGRTFQQTLSIVRRRPPASTTELVNRSSVTSPSAPVAANVNQPLMTSETTSPNITIKLPDGNTATLHEILDKTPELINQPVQLKSKNKTTLLHKTAYHGNLNDTQALLDKAANIDAADFCGLTPLHLATARHHFPVVKLLVNSGANLEATDNKGRTPLHVAATFHCSKIANHLMDRGGKADATMDDDSTPLHLAAQYGHSKVAQYLLKQGANPNAKRADGATPLHLAAIHGRPKIGKYLIESNADINEKRQDSTTPLQLARLCKPSRLAPLMPDSPNTFTENNKQRKHYSKFIKQIKHEQSKTEERNQQRTLHRIFRGSREKNAEYTEMRVLEKTSCRSSTSELHPQQANPDSPQTSVKQYTAAGGA